MFQDKMVRKNFGPGHLGIHPSTDPGRGNIVAHVTESSQADKEGVRKGWKMVMIDGQTFSLLDLKEKLNGNLDYTITFEAKKGARTSISERGSKGEEGQQEVVTVKSPKKSTFR